MSNVTELLDRPIAYHRVFVTLTGSVKAAILLSQAMYWQKRAKRNDGWWYKTAEEWEEETGLSRRELETARRDCEKYLKTDLRDSPARLYWKVDEEVLSKDLIQFGGKRQTEIGGNVETSLAESAKPVSTKTPNINRNAETTTETTTNAGGLSKKELEQANRQVTDMIAHSRKKTYQNRDKIPEPYLAFADLYHELTGQEPTKRAIFDWFATFEDWKQEGLEFQHIRAAWEYANRPEGGFAVGRPGALTNTAVAMKSKAIKNNGNHALSVVDQIKQDFPEAFRE